MSKVDATAADVDYFLSTGDQVAFKQFVSSTAHEYVWRANDGTLLRALGSGFVVDSNGTISGGIVRTIQVDLDGDADFTTGEGVDILVAGIAADLDEVVVKGNRIESASAFWNSVLEGRQRFLAGDAANGNLFGDFWNVIAEGADTVEALGSDDTFLHGGVPPDFFQGNDVRVVAGDAFYVTTAASGQAVLTGGNDKIRMSGNFGTGVAGDSYQSNNGSHVVGGDDSIFVAQIGSPSFGDPYIVGDVDRSFGDLDGGDDVLHDQGRSWMSGDAGTNRGILIGGDDRTIGGAFVAGDAIVSSTQLTGGNDILIGDQQENRLYGDVFQWTGGKIAGGKDILRGGDGFDYMVGDSGTNDVVLGVAANFRGGDDLLRSGAGEANVLIGDLDGLINGTAIGGNDRLIGDLGDEGLYGDFSYPSTLFGFNLKGNYTGGDDILDGHAGNDLLNGDAPHYYKGMSIDCGDDTLRGGDGNDSIYGDIQTFDPTDPVDVTFGNDLLIGGLGTDFIDGGGGFDIASFAIGGGGAVSVYMFGYSGVAHGQNTPAEGGDNLSRIEAIAGSNRDDTIFGESGDYWFSGNRGNDNLSAAAGNDTIIGGTGRDTLSGGGGNDSLTGSRSADLLEGGGGADVFFYLTASDSGPSAGARDTVSDFTTGEDQLDLSNLDANLAEAGDQAFALDEDGSFSPGEISVSVLGSDLLLSLNQDNDVDAEMTVLLQNLSTVTELDFVL